MPDSQGQLTPEDTEKFLKWMTDRSEGGTKSRVAYCGLCQSNNWTIGTHIVSFNSFSPAAPGAPGPKTYPSVAMICQVCGFTWFVNALISQIVPSDPKPDQQAELMTIVPGPVEMGNG